MPSAPVSDLKSEVLDLLTEAGLSRISGAIQDCIKDSLILKTKGAQEKAIRVGQTKIGGTPDLPMRFQWPSWQEKSLAFVAQINLVELPNSEFLKALPKSGILYFFYAVEQTFAGYDPNDKGGWRVLYGDTNDISRREFPKDLPKHSRYKSCVVSFLPSITIPGYFLPCIVDLGLSAEESDQFFEFERKAAKIVGTAGNVHRLLGQPDQIQHEDMQLECQLVSNGINRENATSRNDPRAAALKMGAKDWELLLQIDSDRNAGMMWGDVGRLYYWIPRVALSQKSFEATWVIMECS